MKKLYRIALVIGALALFATGFQAKSAQVHPLAGGKTGDVIVTAAGGGTGDVVIIG